MKGQKGLWQRNLKLQHLSSPSCGFSLCIQCTGWTNWSSFGLFGLLFWLGSISCMITSVFIIGFLLLDNKCLILLQWCFICQTWDLDPILGDMAPLHVVGIWCALLNPPKWNQTCFFILNKLVVLAVRADGPYLAKMMDGHFQLGILLGLGDHTQWDQLQSLLLHWLKGITATWIDWKGNLVWLHLVGCVCLVEHHGHLKLFKILLDHQPRHMHLCNWQGALHWHFVLGDFPKFQILVIYIHIFWLVCQNGSMLEDCLLVIHWQQLENFGSMLLGVTVPHFRLKHGTRMSDIPFALYGFNRHNVQSLKISSSQGTNHQSGCGCSAATPTLLAWHSPHLSLVALLCLGCLCFFIWVFHVFCESFQNGF